MEGVGEGIRLQFLRGRKNVRHVLHQLRGQVPRVPTLNPGGFPLALPFPHALSMCPVWTPTSSFAISEQRDLDQVNLLSLAVALSSESLVEAHSVLAREGLGLDHATVQAMASSNHMLGDLCPHSLTEGWLVA